MIQNFHFMLRVQQEGNHAFCHSKIKRKNHFGLGCFWAWSGPLRMKAWAAKVDVIAKELALHLAPAFTAGVMCSQMR